MKYLLAMVLLMVVAGCGTEREVVREPDPGRPPVSQPPGGDDDPDDDLSYPEMQALLNNYCLSCHASARFMQSEQALRGSRVEEELITRSMPPPNANKQLPDAERELMISFF